MKEGISIESRSDETTGLPLDQEFPKIEHEQHPVGPVDAGEVELSVSQQQPEHLPH